MVQRIEDGKRIKWRAQVRVAGKLRSHTFGDKRSAEKKEEELKKAQEAIRAVMEAPEQGVLMYDYGQQWLKKRYQMRKVARGTSTVEASRLRMYILDRVGTVPRAHW